MKTQHTVKTVNPESVIFEVERIIKFTKPNMFYKEKLNNLKDSSYEEFANEVKVIIQSLDEKNLMLRYSLLDMLNYKKQTNNLFARAILDIDYYDEILLIDDIEKIKEITRNTAYYSNAYTKSKQRLNDIYQNKLIATDDIQIIESILAECSWQCDAYDYGLNLLIPHYTIEVNKLQSKWEVENYLDYIKIERGVYLSSSKDGYGFIKYCDEKGYELDIVNSTTPEEVLDIRDKIINTYKNLVVICDEKLSKLTADMPCNNSSNDEVMKKYKFVTNMNQQRKLLKKYSTETRSESDTCFYWYIYQELLNNFPELNSEIASVKDKLIQAFHVRTKNNDSFQELYDIFYEPTEQNTDKISQYLTDDETVLVTIIDRINKATIIELEKCIVTFCYTRNFTIYETFIQRFFTLSPTIDELLAFEKELLSVKSFLTEHERLIEMFHHNADRTIIEYSNAGKIKEFEMKKYFAIANNPLCINAKKTLIWQLANEH